MDTRICTEKCFSFINSQAQPPPAGAGGQTPAKLAVTLSRETGSGALIVAERLADILQARAPVEGRPWTVFDRNLVERVLEDHHLPAKLARFMPEDRVSAIEDMMQELLGLHPSSWDLIHQTTETILKLAELGNVILVGRGSTVITAKLKHVFHVRLVGSLERRVERVEEHLKLSHRDAVAFVDREDKGRRRYLREHFHVDLSDPLLYHLVINTDRISCEDAAQIISDSVLRLRAECSLGEHLARRLTPIAVH